MMKKSTPSPLAYYTGTRDTPLTAFNPHGEHHFPDYGLLRSYRRTMIT